ncbi:helix-turn-helix domain-containing protein [Pseudonocardia sp. TRM90224]|uniref:helix-turn-helix domain-containing protein n=1 Tax=Pseudonocardia sp. TRM90224 TaxID=2812678 RepID=UPI001E648B86|nr:AraC family transcriptional regulator [Pseudonocardia sp. TRM90224]
MAGGLVIGDGWASHEGGPFHQSDMHHHAAFQVAVALEGEVSLVEPSGRTHRAAALLVPPMVWHQLLPVPRLRTFFVEPHSVFADRLRARGGVGISPAPDLVDLHADDLRAALGPASSTLDARLVAAMRAATTRDLTMAELAATVGLSPQRLRALARQQLGMPLTKWRIWRRIARAVTALDGGVDLADAAATAGFTDQAHFTRQMHEMMGITPREVRRALRPPSHVDRD